MKNGSKSSLTSRAAWKRGRLLRPAFYLYCIAAIVLSVWQMGVYQGWSRSPQECVRLSQNMAAQDLDLYQWLLPGLAAMTRWPQTLAWWHGTWVGQVPFWRPLTSYAFWLEYRLFSPERFDRWFWVSAVSHLIFTVTLFVFVRRLTRRPVVAALTALLFAGVPAFSPFAWADWRSSFWHMPVFGFDAIPPAKVALDSWKNQPEAWTGALTLTALTCALSRRWAACLVCTGLSIGFKESGWLTFPLIGLALWADGSLLAVPRRIFYSAGVLALSLLCLRAASGWTVFYGYHMGSNGHWAARYGLECLGPYVRLFALSASAPPALLGTALFLLTRIPGLRLPVRLLAAFAVTLAMGAIMAVQEGQGLAVALTMLVMWNMGFQPVVVSFLWLLEAATVWNAVPHRVVLAVTLCGMVAALPLAAAAQVQAHVLYLPYAFDSILIAFFLGAAGKRLVSLFGRHIPALSRGRVRQKQSKSACFDGVVTGYFFAHP